jgi:hypothetical protein
MEGSGFSDGEMRLMTEVAGDFGCDPAPPLLSDIRLDDAPAPASPS